MKLRSEHLVLDTIARMRGPTAFSPAFLARCVMRDEYFDKSGASCSFRLLAYADKTSAADGELHVGTNLPSTTVAALLAERGVSPVEIGGAAAFIDRCLTVDPEERPTAAELLQDPWLSDA